MDDLNNETTQLARIETRPSSVFTTGDQFDQAQRVAKMLAESDLVPEVYQGKISNCMIALEIANRTGTGAFEVTQNLEVIKGRPSWKSSYVIAKLNSCGRFTPLEFETEDRGKKTVEYEYTDWSGGRKSREKKKIEIDDKACRVVTESRHTGRVIHGPWVSIELAVLEGWYDRTGSKWQTMPEIMLQYRAASFFGRMSAPEVMLGMHSADEVQDIGEVIVDYDDDGEPAPATKPASKVEDLNKKAEKAAADKAPETKAEPEPEKTKKEKPEEKPGPKEQPEDEWEDEDDDDLL